jgi:acetate kinase
MSRLLAVNAGSSSVKLALFSLSRDLQSEFSVQVDRIGHGQSRLTVHDTTTGHVRADEHLAVPDHAAAFRTAVESIGGAEHVEAVGHRVVRAERHHASAEAITPSLMKELGSMTGVDPDHAPQILAVIAEAGRRYPAARHFACFDSAFHRTMPPVAQRYPLQGSLGDEGILRFGFHGLSCESVIDQLRSIDPRAVDGRVIVAHLGSGASLTAVAGGRSLDTTMGFSPTGGIVMSTRTGDLDPSVLLFLLERHHNSAAELRRLVNQQSGLLGVSGSTGDMRELLAIEASDARAADAVALFCYTARKHLGGLVAVLGGVDTLVFTGGIGEHAAPIRDRVCAGLEGIGIVLDPVRNARGDPVISSEASRAVVRVIAANEELMIAKHVRRLLASDGVDDVSV